MTRFLEINDSVPSLASGQWQRNDKKRQKREQLGRSTIAVVLGAGCREYLIFPTRRNCSQKDLVSILGASEKVH